MASGGLWPPAPVGLFMADGAAASRPCARCVFGARVAGGGGERVTASNAQPHVLLDGISFGEQPRWHEGRLWFSDWGSREVIAVDLEGRHEVILSAPSFPCCVDWLPDGRLLVVSARDGRLLRQEADRSLVTHGNLGAVSKPPAGNELVVDGRGNAYVNGGGFDLMAGEPFAPGIVALVTLDGSVRPVADGLAFPNGMLVTPDNATLIVAESYAKRLTAFDIEDDGSLSGRRVWAELGDGVPDGICLDADNAVWYGDVPNARCVRVREGGEVLQTIELDRGCFACALGGADRTTLCMMATEWDGPDNMFAEPRTGKVLTVEAPAPGVGWP
jgi:sugar lactone lactonase YvrE